MPPDIGSLIDCNGNQQLKELLNYFSIGKNKNCTTNYEESFGNIPTNNIPSNNFSFDLANNKDASHKENENYIVYDNAYFKNHFGTNDVLSNLTNSTKIEGVDDIKNQNELINNHASNYVETLNENRYIYDQNNGIIDLNTLHQLSNQNIDFLTNTSNPGVTYQLINQPCEYIDQNPNQAEFYVDQTSLQDSSVQNIISKNNNENSVINQSPLLFDQSQSPLVHLNSPSITPLFLSNQHIALNQLNEKPENYCTTKALGWHI